MIAMRIKEDRSLERSGRACWGFAVVTLLGLQHSGLGRADEVILWKEDFEDIAGANDRWHADFGVWEMGKPAESQGKAYQGQNCAKTVLGGNYPETADSRLIRHEKFVVPPASENPRLRFWHYYSFSVSDSAWVEIREEGGNWEQLSPNSWYWWDSAWTRPLMDLSKYAGKKVEIGFYFQARDCCDWGDVSSGWYIDDVEVVTGPRDFLNPEDFENGLGEWWVDRGVWEVGPGPAHSGLGVAKTILNGNYPENADSRLVSPPFVVPPAGENPRLRFWHYYSFSVSDSAWVEIRVVGQNWLRISDVYSGVSGSWSFPFIDLTPYGGQQAEIAFYFQARDCCDWADTSSGWSIDQVTIEPRPSGAGPFRRGDANADGEIDITDAVAILGFLFQGVPLTLSCEKAADTNDSATLDITDAVYLLRFLYSSGAVPPAPFPGCGSDPTLDGIPCGSYPAGFCQ